jgi:hypothetical protein
MYEYSYHRTTNSLKGTRNNKKVKKRHETKKLVAKENVLDLLQDGRPTGILWTGYEGAFRTIK